MGKPYRCELADLPKTYSWAYTEDIDALESVLSATSAFPLLAVGSGGSLSAACFMAYLHQCFTQQISKSVTPLDLYFTPIDLHNVSVAFLTAGGRNPDIIGSLRKTISGEPKHILALCLRSGSPISGIAARHSVVSLVEFDLPSGKDGFLATNSLLATGVLLTRAYGRAGGGLAELPSRLQELLHPGESITKFMSRLRSLCHPLWDKNTIIVLHGPATQAAAVDLESKFTEAALRNVQVCDYRNFAHGRHYWLAKRGEESAILALFSDEDRDIAEKTLDLIPLKVPVVRLDVKRHGVLAALAALALSVHVIGIAGEESGSDPGRPKVPLFGRRIYRLSAFKRATRNDGLISPSEAIAIERKSGINVSILANNEQIDFWRRAYHQFVDRLTKASFGAVVFDYDVTLCVPSRRYGSLGKDITGHLRRLLRGGILIGVATGRGQSIRKALQEAIPKRYWRQVLVGYYNGADIAPLDDDTSPDKKRPMHPALLKFRSLLEVESFMANHADIEYRPRQASVQPRSRFLNVVRRWLLDNTAAYSSIGVRVFESSHSFDVLPEGVSKRHLVSACKEVLAKSGVLNRQVLCIGDKGRWPGNDCELLATPYSLSVDEVSSDSHTCWNLAPPGCRRVQAARQYLQSMQAELGLLRFMATERRNG